jgi:hypothetical protein
MESFHPVQRGKTADSRDGWDPVYRNCVLRQKICILHRNLMRDIVQPVFHGFSRARNEQPANSNHRFDRFSATSDQPKNLVVEAKYPIEYQPGVIPQFDARVRRGNDTALLAQSKDEVKQMFLMAKETLDAKPSGPKIVWITSWNEWHEGTAIEPTETGGKKYPGGNYGFDFLEALSEVFQP